MFYVQFFSVLGFFLLFLSGYMLNTINLTYTILGVLLCLLSTVQIRLARNRLSKNIGSQLTNNDSSESYALMSQMVTRATSKMAMGAAEVSHFVDILTKDIHLTHKDSEQITKAVEVLSDTGITLSNNLGQLAHTMSDTVVSSITAQEALTRCMDQVNELTGNVHTANQKLALLTKSADEIDSITAVIKGVSEQTNLLALNAAIEAARAGEQGRGFAVVADEVRSLAGKSAEASEKISTLLADVRRNSELTNNEMTSLSTMTELLSDSLRGETERFVALTEEVKNASTVLSEVESTGEELGSTSVQINGSISRINHSLEEISERSDAVSQEASSLSKGAEVVFRELDKVDKSLFFSNLVNTAKACAQGVTDLFEEAISKGELTEQAVFSRNYQPINGTNPPKYSTDYDSFSDRTFPDIQEAVLENYEEVMFAGAVDVNGYFPTHNKKFSQPLSGDYEKDLINSRTKRIFDDPTGSRCGAHTDSFLLQTYKRDTGEILHDLSVPIFVNGKHWGGFRMGFKANYL